MNFFFQYKYSISYVVLIPVLNWAFSWAPVWDLPFGGSWTPFSILPGLALVFRDFSQREIGHRVLWLLLIGTVLSYFMAAPEIAIASGLAFLVSELVDWSVYTFTGKPLSERILYSSLLAAPLDTLMFFYGAEMVVPGIFSTGTVIAAVLSKLAAAAFVAWLVRQRENTNTEENVQSC